MIHWDRFDFLARSTWPEDFDLIGFKGLTEANGDRQFRLGKIATGGHDLPPEGFPIRANLDPGTDAITIAFDTDQFQPSPMMLQVLIVAEQQRRAAPLGYY